MVHGSALAADLAARRMAWATGFTFSPTVPRRHLGGLAGWLELAGRRKGSASLLRPGLGRRNGVTARPPCAPALTNQLRCVALADPATEMTMPARPDHHVPVVPAQVGLHGVPQDDSGA